VCEEFAETDVAIRKETLILRQIRKVALDVIESSMGLRRRTDIQVYRPSWTFIAARESCAGSPRTLPEDSINGDSIEVVRQEDASEDHRRIEALVNALQEYREGSNTSEAKELDQGQRTEVGRQADRNAGSKEAVAGDAHQTRGNDGAPTGSDCGETGRSGRRRPRRKREGPSHHLTAVRKCQDETGRLEPPRLALTILAVARSDARRSAPCRSA
jgi:hypothetical protein